MGSGMEMKTITGDQKVMVAKKIKKMNVSNFAGPIYNLNHLFLLITIFHTKPIESFHP